MSVIANILAGRFADHQPYHRQYGQFARQGISFAPNTLVSLVRQACEKLDPIYRAIIAETLATSYLMMDPTPVALMSPRKKGSTKEACKPTERTTSAAFHRRGPEGSG